MNSLPSEYIEFFNDNYGIDLFKEICILYDQFNAEDSHIFNSTRPNEIYNLLCNNINYDNIDYIEDDIGEDCSSDNEYYN